MKYFLFLLLLGGLISCKEPKTEKAFAKQIQGVWIMEEAKLSGMSNWEPMPSTEEPVVITEDHIGNPWNRGYDITDVGVILLDNNTEINVVIYKKDCMLFASQGDSLRFTRQ